MDDDQLKRVIAEIEGIELAEARYEYKLHQCAKGWPSWSEADERAWKEEGWEYSRDDFVGSDYTEVHVWRRLLAKPIVSYGDWDPFVWRCFGPLIEKYRVDLQWCPSDLNQMGEERGLRWRAGIYDYTDPEFYRFVCEAYDPSIFRAGLLVIAMAHGNVPELGISYETPATKESDSVD